MTAWLVGIGAFVFILVCMSIPTLILYHQGYSWWDAMRVAADNNDPPTTSRLKPGPLRLYWWMPKKYIARKVAESWGIKDEH